MPRKSKVNKKQIKQINMDKTPEQKKIEANREYRFKEILGKNLSAKELSFLVASDIDYHELENMINNGCPPEIAIKILY